MSDNRILFISQEISPYLPSNEISEMGRSLPQHMQESGREVRIFMPKFGPINERRNQLHEVIRLSGINISIDDTDHPLIIKVASMLPSRIQVYFVDNEDFFQKSAEDVDPVGSNRADNDERAIFFTRGTMETVKKLRWEPAIIHCTGWFTGLVPIYLRKAYSDDLSFQNAKIVYTITENELTTPFDPRFIEKLIIDGIAKEDLEAYKADTMKADTMHKIAIDYCDGVVFNTENINEELLEKVKSKEIPYLTKQEVEGNLNAYNDFYKSLFTNEK